MISSQAATKADLFGWNRLPPLLGLVGLLSTRWKESSCKMPLNVSADPADLCRLSSYTSLAAHLLCKEVDHTLTLGIPAVACSHSIGSDQLHALCRGKQGCMWVWTFCPRAEAICTSILVVAGLGKVCYPANLLALQEGRIWDAFQLLRLCGGAPAVGIVHHIWQAEHRRHAGWFETLLRRYTLTPSRSVRALFWLMNVTGVSGLKPWNYFTLSLQAWMIQVCCAVA